MTEANEVLPAKVFLQFHPSALSGNHTENDVMKIHEMWLVGVGRMESFSSHRSIVSPRTTLQKDAVCDHAGKTQDRISVGFVGVIVCPSLFCMSFSFPLPFE